jgi:hypothetical protein
MATQKMIMRPAKSYTDFLGHVLRAIEAPPIGETCAICLSDFEQEQDHQTQDETSCGTTAQPSISAAALTAATTDEEIYDVALR